MKDSTNLPDSIDKAKFSVVRKGYDKDEVRNYLQDLESAFRDLETWSKKAKVQLAEAEARMSVSQAEADGSVDNAMFAVFDAKDRILDKARRRAEQIEEEALQEAEEIKARAARLSGESGADELLAAAREEAQDIIARAKRDASKVAAESASVMEQQMVQKDQQLSSMREQLVASKSDSSADGSSASAVIAAAQAKADGIVRQAHERADSIVAAAQSNAPDGGGDAAAAAILEAAYAQAAEIEARANQLRETAEHVLADAEAKYALARAALEAAEQGGASPPSGFSNISDETLMAGMAGELRAVHDQVENRRAELTELHDLVDERRSELTEVHDLVEERRFELTHIRDSVTARQAELAEIDSQVEARRLELREAFDAAEAQKAEAREAAAQLAAVRADVAGSGDAPPSDERAQEILAAAKATAADIADRANEEAARVREEAMHMLAEVEKERSALHEERAAADGSPDEADGSRVFELEATIAEFREKIDKDQRQALAWSEVVDEMKAQIAELTADLEAKDAALESVAALESGDVTGDQTAHFESQVAELTSQLEVAHTVASEQRSGLEARIAELSSELAAKDAELEGAGHVSEQVVHLEARVGELSSELAAKDAELTSRAAQATEQVDVLQARVDELSSQLATKDADFENRSAQAGEQVSRLEGRVAELSSQVEAKTAEHEAVVADLSQESSALAARLAELHDQAEANRARLESAQAQAARVEPLSRELTKVQVAVKAKETELVEAAELISKAATLAGRVGELESQLSEANAAVATIPMLQSQVAGLKVRADKAEEAAELASSQLADIVRSVDQAESDAIRREAAAEAARIRELTEDSLGIAHAATAGTGLDADDYVASATDLVEVNTDPDDWSDVFGAADAYLARRAAAAADAIVTDRIIESVVADQSEALVPENVEASGDKPVLEQAIDEPGVEQSYAAAAPEEFPAYAEAEDSLDEPVVEGSDGLPVSEEDSYPAAAEELVEEPLVEESYAEPAAVVNPYQEAPAEELVEEPVVEESYDEPAAEVEQYREHAESYDEPGAEAEPYLAEFFGEPPVGESHDEAVAHESAVGVVYQEATEFAAPDEPHEPEAPMVESDEPANVFAATGSIESLEPVAPQDDFDAFTAPVDTAAMAERLRLARAELEAELDPATVAGEEIGVLPADEVARDVAEYDAAGEEDDENTMSGLIRRKAGQTRYARQSAKLPRIGESGDAENEDLSALSGFRARMLGGKSKDND